MARRIWRGSRPRSPTWTRRLRQGFARRRSRQAGRRRGCTAAARREEGSTYRWAYDGTYIYGADSKTVPAERTYWTDEGGSLVGRSKGGPGQTWSLAAWKPTEAQPDPVRAVALTGLFGPIAGLLGS